MPASNGHVSAPVSIADVRKALGEASNDLGTLCKSAKINKWSLCKPVKKEQLEALTADQFKVTPTEGSTATRYGLRCTSAQAVYNVHSCDYKYFPPQGGSAQPYRLTDFNQYRHSGYPEILGTSFIEGTSIDPSTGSLALNLLMNYNGDGDLEPSPGCVSLAGLSGDSLDNVLGYYVCCMMSGTSGNAPVGNTNYAICCTNTSTGAITPVKSGTAIYNAFHAPLDSAPSGVKATGPHYVSFFLVQSTAGFKPNTAWASWTSISTQLVISSNWLAIPGAVGLLANVQNAADKFIISGMTATRRQMTSGNYRYTVNATWSFNTDTANGGVAAGTSVSVRIQLQIGNVSVSDTTATYTVDASQHNITGYKDIGYAFNSSTATCVISDTASGSSKSDFCKVAIFS